MTSPPAAPPGSPLSGGSVPETPGNSNPSNAQSAQDPHPVPLEVHPQGLTEDGR
jgi:hypothetical protein